MTFIGKDDERRIVPRWRSPEAAAAAGEFCNVATTNDQSLPNLQGELVEAREAWKSGRSLGSAAELIAASILAGKPAEALEAAEYVLANRREAGPLLTDRARSLFGQPSKAVVETTRIDPASTTRSDLAAASYQRTQKEIEPLKLRVTADPRDALAWLEMGRLQATAGNDQHARRAVRIALGLAQHSRFVLRSVARFLVHTGEKEEAHELLRRNSRTKHDPWLAAAEIATAQVANVSPRSIKVARGMIESGRFSDNELSELRAALATDAFVQSRRRDVRKHVEASLEQPTENTVAQAEWLVRKAKLNDVTMMVRDLLKTPGSFEARAFDAYSQMQWERALEDAYRWIDDEPFSGRAAILAASVAGVALEKYGEAVDVLRAAVRASPWDAVLKGNLVYTLATAGRPREAESELRDIRPDTGSIQERVVHLANAGLVSFRTHDQVRGRQLYTEAVQLAEKNRMADFARLAKVYWLAEELVAGNQEHASEASALLGDTSKLGTTPDERLAIVRLRREFMRFVRSE